MTLITTWKKGECMIIRRTWALAAPAAAKPCKAQLRVRRLQVAFIIFMLSMILTTGTDHLI